MSVSVSNIVVSIKGIQSEQNYIELEGSRFALDSFELSQQLLQPCRLSFNMFKDTEEDISDVQFGTCSFIIGAEVTLLMQTTSMEEGMEREENSSIIMSRPCFMAESSGRYFVMSVLMGTRKDRNTHTSVKRNMTGRMSLRWSVMKAAAFFIKKLLSAGGPADHRILTRIDRPVKTYQAVLQRFYNEQKAERLRV